MNNLKQLVKPLNDTFSKQQQIITHLCTECQELEVQGLLNNPSDVQKHSDIFMEFLDQSVYLQNNLRRALNDTLRDAERMKGVE